MEDHLIEVGGIKIDENDNYEISDCLYCYKKIDLIAYNLTKKTQDYKLLCYDCFINSCKHKLIKEELIMLTILNLNTINKESYLKIYEILSKITRLKPATIIEALIKFSEKYDFFYSKEEKVVLNIKKIKDNYKALNENSFHRLVDYEIKNIRELEEFWEQ